MSEQKALTEGSELSPALAAQLGQNANALIAIRNNTVDNVQEQYDCTRDEARAIVRYAYEQEEADHRAFAPSGSDYLEARIDTSIRDELNRLMDEQVEYKAIVAQGDTGKFGADQKFKRAGGASLTAGEAKERLALNFNRILEIKKVLSASKAQKPDGGTNIEVNLGSIVSDIIGNINDAEH